MLDITSRLSFDQVEKEILTYQDHCNIEARHNIIIVGNKSDLAYKREVSREECEELAKRLKSTYIECSALTDFSVD